jgi:predicted S18 family serine protease
MRRHRFSRCFPLVLVLGLLGACASAPVQEMSDARQAIMAAEQSGAEKTAPGTLGDARTLLTEAEAQLQDGRYYAARRNAIEAKARALEAMASSADAGRKRDNGS